ncbi:MAG TPA: hypothetical protein VFS05_00670 [Gemmatimonadaceae bacterium]|nr:hypothetical protein [Gemmatimonadaceae bacterium]
MIALALVVALRLPAAPPPPDRWFAPDKIKHFFMAAFVQSVTYSAIRAADGSHRTALAGATAVTAAVSVGKEAHDWRARRQFSVRDLAWDAAGAATATVLLNHTPR